MSELGDNIKEDPWLARDKLYHVFFSFFLAFLFSHLASLAPYPLLRRHSIRVGSTLSLLAGAAKEAADHLGIFPSAGASAKDAVADAIGVLIAALALSMRGAPSGSESGAGSGQTKRVLPV